MTKNKTSWAVDFYLRGKGGLTKTVGLLLDDMKPILEKYKKMEEALEEIINAEEHGRYCVEIECKREAKEALSFDPLQEINSMLS